MSIRLLVWITFSVGLIVSSSYAPAPDNNNGTGGTLDYEYFKFALQWPDGYCFQNKRCRTDFVVPEDKFVVRGLCPQRFDQSNQMEFKKLEFDISLLDAETTLRQEYLQMCWPGLVKSNEEWWDWEYTKHAQFCFQDYDEVHYFSLGWKLWTENDVYKWLKYAKIVPGSHYYLKDIETAIINQIGVHPIIRCRLEQPEVSGGFERDY